MPILPAIVIGGPPHSGKSVLTYSLTQLLRHQRIEHYVLRACPDGEGDWSNEITPERVLAIRQKGKFTDSFIANVCRAIQARHLPLLVDVGGAPTTRDEAIFRCCTHLIILSKSREEMAVWRVLAERTGLPILAEIDSALEGEEQIDGVYPLLAGRMVGLTRGTVAQGALLEHLAGLVSSLFATKEDELRQLHLGMAPTELVVDLDRVAAHVDLKKGGWWQPDDLLALLPYLPAQTPQAFYGRGTVWIYAALALYTNPAPFYQFDARLGWVEPVRLHCTNQPANPWLTFTVTHNPAYSRLLVQIPDTYLDYDRLQDTLVPTLNLQAGVVLDGRLPYWLYCGLVRAYAAAPWVAIHQPQLHGAVVVASRVADYPLAALVPF